LAYSLNDLYQPLRSIMRVDALVVGFGVGSLLLLAHRERLAEWGVYDGGAVWMGRLAGALLIALGASLLIASRERAINLASLIGMGIGNALMAVVLISAYLQREFADLSLVGQIGLVGVFVTCLVAALAAIYYVRIDLQT
jgi:hypothetical protein